MCFSEENLKGFVLALLSSGFIGASFIIKKKGLKKAAAASGVRAGLQFLSHFFSNSVDFFSISPIGFLIFFNGYFLILILVFSFLGVGGHSYLLEPLWWFGMITSKYCFHLGLFISHLFQDL